MSRNSAFAGTLAFLCTVIISVLVPTASLSAQVIDDSSSQSTLSSTPGDAGVRLPTTAGITQRTDEVMQRQAAAPPRPERPEPELEYPDRSHLPQNPLASASSGFPAGASQNPAHAPDIHSTAVAFDGATLTDTGAFPPDSMGTAGPTQFIVFINGRMRSFTKTGVADGVLNVNPDVFFAPVSTPVGGSVVLDFTSDPQIRYDRFTSRWYMSIIDVPCTNGSCSALGTNRWMVAVSDATSNGTITGATVWTLFYTQVDTTNFCDYPSLGVDVNALYFGCNMFTPAGSFAGTNGYVVQKGSTLGAGPMTVTAFANLATSTGAGPSSPRGVDNLDPAATEGYFVGTDNATFGTIMFRRVSNPGSATPTISSNISVAVSTTTYPNPVEHLGNTGGNNGRLDSLDDRLFAATIRGGHLWTTHNIRVNTSGVANTATQARNAARWYEFQNLATTPTVVQSGTVYDSVATRAASHQYWIPSIAPTGQGHAVIGFSEAGAIGATPSYTGRLASDAPGTMAGVPGIGVVQFGTSASSYNPSSDPGGSAGRRWGDYSFTVVDPLDEMSVWTIQEYNQATGSYAVRVGKLLAPPPATPACSASPIAFNGGTGDVVIDATSASGSAFYDPGANLPSPAQPFSHVSATMTNATVNSVTYNSPSEVTLNITANTAGLQDVTITNPDGQSVTAGGCVDVVPAIVTHAVTPSVGTPSGTIAPSTSQTVNDGDTTSFTLTPDAGFQIGSVGGTCGGSLAGSVFTTAAVTTDCTVVANFAPIVVPVCGSGNPVEARASAGNTGPIGYPTLKGAFDAINAGTHQGAIEIAVCGDTAEAASAVLNASGTGSSAYTSVKVNPAGGALRTVSGAMPAGSPLIDLSGADNVTIDGLNTGGNALTFSNTTASTTAGTSTIRFIGGASGNAITRCTVLGSSSATAATAGGNILFSTSTVAGGNSSNTVSDNDIGPAGTSLPTKGVMGLGTAANPNTANLIEGNRIFDFFSPTVASAGVSVQANNNNWTISNNRIYQSAARTFTATAQRYSGILVAAAGGTFVVSNNTIGFGAADGSGTTTISGSTNEFRGIAFTNSSTVTYSTIDGNTISGINLTSNRNSTSTDLSSFIGIQSGSSATDAPANISDNTIGSLDGSSTIVINAGSTTANTAPVQGILDFNFVGNLAVSNNSVGSVTINNNAGAGSVTGFRGILVGSTTGVTHTLEDNTIGGTAPGSISDTIVGNVAMYGIQVGSANVNASGNLIRNMTANSTTVNGVVLSGLLTTASTGTNTISGNTVHSLSNNAGAASNSIYALYCSFAAVATNVVERNLVHSLSITSTATTSQLAGILPVAGSATYRNNMVRLGDDASGAPITSGLTIYGMFEIAGANNLYNNSVYVGGTNVAAASNTFAFVSNVASATRNYLDNIFWNARSNASGIGKNYAIAIGGTGPNPAGLISDYNDLFANGSGGFTGLFNGVDQTTIGDWRTAIGQDADSFAGDPQFIAPDGSATTGNLHISLVNPTPIEASGFAIADVTDDFDREVRADFTPTDVGADAGDFVPLGVTHTVTPSVAGGNGSIAPPTPQTVNDGATIGFTLTPDAGYQIDTVGGTCGGALAGNVYTTTPVTADCTVVASFALVVVTHTVTPSVAGGNGTIAPSTPQTVNDGAAIGFTVTPDAGYQIDTVGGTCGGALAGNVYTTTPVTADCTVVASFALIAVTHMVTPSVSGGNGTIAPSTPQTVNDGATTGFTLTPDAGYQIDTVDGTCGGALAGNVYTTVPVTTDCTVIASFVTAGVAGTFPPDETFEEVTAPALPSDWPTAASGAGLPWITQTTVSDTAPNAAFAPDILALSDMTLDTPTFTPVTGQTVSFRHQYNLEHASSGATAYDGAVLEISINGGAFADIVTAGGSFTTGGYNSTIAASFGSPIGGRAAWSGNSGGFVDALATLPASSAGQPTVLRFRTADDSSDAATGTAGWWVDTIHLGAPTAAPVADVTPTSLDFTVAAGAIASNPLTIANTGGGTLNWSITEATAASVRPDETVPLSAKDLLVLAQKAARGGPLPDHVITAPLPNPQPRALVIDEGFDDITALAGAGWLTQDNGSSVGTNPVWFQGDGTNNFPAFDGGINAYIAANFNSIVGTGTISMWLVTPQITFSSGAAASFYTRTFTGSTFPDRMQVRLCTAMPCTNLGAGPTDVGDFTTVLLDINPTYAVHGYPEAWTQETLSGLPTSGSGRIAFRYFVENGGPSGAHSNQVAIDRMVIDDGSVVGGTGCTNPSDVPWLSESATAGAVAGGASEDSTIKVDATTLAAGNYSAHICVATDDPTHALVDVPISVTVNPVTVTHTVTPSVGTASGTIAPSTAQTVNDGATTAFTLTPNAGFHIDTVGGTCGGSLAGNVFTTIAVIADCTVIANFAATVITHTVTPSVGTPSGTIAPSTPQTVNDGDTTAFTLTPAAGFQIDTVGGTCGGNLAGDVFTTNPVTTDCTVVANFAATSVPPVATVTPASLSFTVAADATASDTLTIADAAGSDPLTFSITAQDSTGQPIVLRPHAAPQTKHGVRHGPRPAPSFSTSATRPAGGSSAPAVWSPIGPDGSLMFQVDDGSYENSIGLTNASTGGNESFGAVWINRFAVTQALTLDSISIEWPSTGGLTLGMQPILVAYYDADGDGDPSNAVRLGSDEVVTIDSFDTFENYPVNFSVPGAGDIYVGFVDAWALLVGGYEGLVYPAAIDQDASQGDSWVVGASSSSVVTDITNLANNDLVGTIDSFGLAGNWLIRATGTTGGSGGPCTGPVVTWLSAAPASGSVNGGASVDVTITADPAAGSLVPGSYTADLCVETNDPAQAVIAVPVTLTVTPGAVTDGVFCSGFESGESGSCGSGGTFTQPVQDPSFEATTGDGASNPLWAGSDTNDPGGTPFYSQGSTGQIPTYDGIYAVWFGGWNLLVPETQIVSQSVVISSGGPRYLSYWRMIDVAPDAQGELSITVDGTQVSQVDLAAAGVDGGYVKQSVDISSYADNAAHVIQVQFDQDGSGSTDGNTFIDQVTIEDHP